MKGREPGGGARATTFVFVGSGCMAAAPCCRVWIGAGAPVVVGGVVCAAIEASSSASSDSQLS